MGLILVTSCKGKGFYHSNESRNRDRMLQQHLTTISYILGEFFASTMANTVDCGRFGSYLQSLNCLDLNWIN